MSHDTSHDTSRRRRSRDGLWPLVFLAPLMIGVIVFYFWPILATFLNSFSSFGPFGDLVLGQHHIHHFVPGILLAFLAGGASVVSRNESIDPWLAMAAAVHRSADERPAWHPEQALTPAQAVAASVDGQPTVGVGSRGDLVLLDADPLAVGDTSAETAAALRGMPVALTVVAGTVVHTAL